MALMTENQRDTMMIETHAIVTSHTDLLTSMTKTMHGNGQPGMVQTVAILKTTQDQCPARERAKRDNRMFYIAAVSLVITVATVALSIVGVIG